MRLHHFFSQRTNRSALVSTYEISDDEDGRILLRSTGSAVKTLRALRKHGFVVPPQMNGPQVTQYTVDLEEVAR